MAKKIGIRKIETTVPYDSFISSIDGLVDKVSKVNLEVHFTSKKIYELDDTMFVILDMYDDSGDMKALLVGNRTKDFISLVDNIKYGLKYRISGNVTIPDTEENYTELPFIDEIKGRQLFCIYALQCYSDTIYGIDVDEFNGCIDLKEEYEVLSKYTDYLKDIVLDQVKDVKASCYGKIVILLKDGTLIVNGKKKLDNISAVHYIDNHTIIAISNDNIVTCLTTKGVSGADFLNNNDYHYKKVLINESAVIALTYEGVVVYFGSLWSSVIDYSRFTEVDDIALDDDTGDVIIFKDDSKYSLFHFND